MNELMTHLRHALRTLRRNPLFALVIVLTLALGIGINTAVYTLVHSTLIRPLPFPNPERIYFVVSTLPKMGWNDGFVSIPEIEDVRESSRLLNAVAIVESNHGGTLT